MIFKLTCTTQNVNKKILCPPQKDTTKNPDIQEEIRKGNNECVGKYEMSFNNCISIFEKRLLSKQRKNNKKYSRYVYNVDIEIIFKAMKVKS